MDEQLTLAGLMQKLPQHGKVDWIGIRPRKNDPLIAVDSVLAETNAGLVGDHYAGRSGKRGITLIQAEHLEVIASLLNLDQVTPAMLRRNIAISGVNLLALKQKRFRLGDAVLETTGLCHPCSKMERILGEGGYQAMRGHGGITAKVIRGGLIRCGDALLSDDL